MPRASSATTKTAARSRPTPREVRPIDLEERSQRHVSPLELGLVELPTRPRSEYTLAVRKAAIIGTDSGRMREAADLTRAAMTESGYARGILADLTHGLWGLPRNFVGRPDMIEDLDDTPERVGQWRIMFPEPDAIRLMSWGVTLGVGIGQMRRRYDAAAGDDYPVSPDEADDWKNVKPHLQARPIGAHDTRILRTWDPKFLRNQWWDETWWLMTADGEIRLTPNEGEWMLYLPYGEMRPWEYGAWRSLTLAWLMQRDSIFDRSRHAEVLAPVRVGKVPQGTTERQRKTYFDLIRRMQRMAMFVLPPGLDYTIVESTHKIGDIYEQIIGWAEREFAMVTGAITTGTGARVYAKGGDVQERFTRSILGAFASSLSTCLHSGGLVPWALANYGTPDAPRPDWNTAAPEDQKTKVETLKIAADALQGMTATLAALNRKPTDAAVVKFTQALGIETEALPVRTPHPKLDVTPTAREYAYRLGEVRASDGYPGFGDERDDMTIADAEQLAKKKAQDTPAPGGTTADPTEAADGGEPPTDESAAALAAAMTAHGLERCEHGACNRCRKCGVERLRGFDVDQVTQEVRWHRAWQPIVRGRAPLPVHANGAPSAPPWSAPGGDA